jgi:hypothetical protein
LIFLSDVGERGVSLRPVDPPLLEPAQLNINKDIEKEKRGERGGERGGENRGMQ